ncbi:TPA: site-specific DNA-methyltransferase [Patescibacteria group bacterium]|nr:site-specific DNA-methyltransferase [Patescibacteria group bacterium]HCI05076.1 site-specific DNA-methyltransferase [Patescibacteria group bacterium]
MSFSGAKRKTYISQTVLPTCLSTLAITAVLNARKSGRAHKSDWCGNWSPEVARNLILRYSKEKDHLLDCMIGGGTTAIEAKILNRHITCIDVNDEALERTKKSLEFEVDNKAKQRIAKCDARDMSFIKDNEIDFVLTHPPYADIIKYSEGKIKEDLSGIHDIDAFVDEIEKVAKELFRVLKKGKYCAILMGDTRRNKMYQPLAFKVMQKFLDSGFVLKEDIIKRQFNCKATGFWVTKSKESNFLLIMHEHLFIFQKGV